jgi:hypothetical protein
MLALQMLSQAAGRNRFRRESTAPEKHVYEPSIFQKGSFDNRVAKDHAATGVE